MNNPITQLTNTIPSIRNSPNWCSPWRGFVLIAIVLAFSALLPAAHAVSPPPDGGYPGYNTAEGDNALFRVTGGFGNTAIGFASLFNNTNGKDNTAIGMDALLSNRTGYDNTATGVFALFYNTAGSGNTATGSTALFSNTRGTENTATGNSALANNIVGEFNTATGAGALFRNTAGNYNTALGANAGSNITKGSNNIDIGNNGMTGDANTIRIGTEETHSDAFIAGIFGTTVPEGVPVVIGRHGHLGTVTSSARFKDNLKPMDKASEAIFALRPVTFHYKPELDSAGIPQFGLVAEQVEKVNPELVTHDEEGKAYTVRYEAVNAMLLNEFLKEHHKGQKQDATISELKEVVAQQHKEIKTLAASVKELAAQIQKVSAQLGLRKHAPQLAVVNE
jgi:uncharacterized coiled-coil protein SlyX